MYMTKISLSNRFIFIRQKSQIIWTGSDKIKRLKSKYEERKAEEMGWRNPIDGLILEAETAIRKAEEEARRKNRDYKRSTVSSGNKIRRVIMKIVDIIGL